MRLEAGLFRGNLVGEYYHELSKNGKQENS
jgi:hypothetical protein